jgi:hypothetical protein
MFLFSCETVDPLEPVRVIPDQMQTFVDRFVREAEKRGIAVDVSKLSFEFDRDIKGGTSQNPAIGSCTRFRNLDLITIDTLNSLWLLSGNLGREEMIFHELGHCVLDREHRDHKFISGDFASIMRSTGLLQYGDFSSFVSLFSKPSDFRAHKRDYYIEELFDESTPAPCWSDPNTVSSYPLTIFEETFIKENNYRQMWIDHEDNLWFYGGEKNYQLVGGIFKEKLPNMKIAAMSNDSRGNLWIAGFQDGEVVIGMYQSSIFEPKFYSKDFPSSFTGINQFLVDEENRVWLSDNFGNMYAQSEDGFDLISGFSDGRIWTIRKGPDGTVYVLKEGKFYIYQNPQKFMRFDKDNSDLPAVFFRSLEVDTEGVAWLRAGGSQPYFIQFKPNFETKRLDFANVNLAGTRVNAISSDSFGNIWVATSSGIKKWEGASFSTYCKYNTGVPILNFTQIEVGNDGNIWSLGIDLENSEARLMLSQPGD